MSLANYVPGGLGCSCESRGMSGLGDIRFIGADDQDPGFMHAIDDRTGAIYRVSQPPGGWPKTGDYMNEDRILGPVSAKAFTSFDPSLTSASMFAATTSYSEDAWKSIGGGKAKNIKTMEIGSITTGAASYPNGYTVPARLVLSDGGAGAESGRFSGGTRTSSPTMLASTVPGAPNSSNDNVGGFAQGFASVLSAFGTATRAVAEDPILSPVAQAQLQRLAPRGTQISWANQVPQQASSGPGIGTAVAIGGGLLLGGGILLGVMSRKEKTPA